MTPSSFTLLDGTAFYEKDFSHVLARLHSFRNFPDRHYNTFLTKLVNKGFYFTLHGDLVQCFSCGLNLHVAELTELDNIGLIHQERSPECAFIADVVNNQNDIAVDARFPNYQLGNDRFKSLIRHGIDQSTAFNLARNGLFSEGKRNKVRCFYCRKGVQLHKNHLHMNKEHANKSPNCSFVRREQESSSSEWQFDSVTENLTGEICPPSSADVMLDKEESQKRLMCANCQKNEKCATFLPCNHSCLCEHCVQQMRPNRCLVCQQNIEDIFIYKLANVSDE